MSLRAYGPRISRQRTSSPRRSSSSSMRSGAISQAHSLASACHAVSHAVSLCRYLRLPGLFAADIAEITAAFEEVWTRRGDTVAALMRGKPRQPHTGSTRSFMVPFIDQNERLAKLLDDPRLEGTVASLCGGDFNYTGGDGNWYSGDTQWHSDGHSADKSSCRFVKCAWCGCPFPHVRAAHAHARARAHTRTLSGSAMPVLTLWGLQQVPRSAHS